jgi:hypothetical protein
VLAWRALAHSGLPALIVQMSDTPEITARQRRWPPVVVAMFIQCVAATLTVGAAALLAPTRIVFSLLAAAVLTGVFAVILSTVARLERWWLVMQFAFAPALVLVSDLHLPRAVWLALFALLVAVYWSTFRTQVPLYLSSTKVRQALIPLLPAGPFTFIDIGSGVGGVLIDLAAARGDGEYHGIESAPFPWLVSWLRIASGGHRNCHVAWGSLWKCDLAKYDVVFAYLSPVPMAALWEKVQREMRPGTMFISNTFTAGSTPPTRQVTVDDLHGSTLYVWTRV